MDEMNVLFGAIQKLEGINVPVALAQQITVPLLEVSAMLKQLYNARAEAAKKAEAQQKETEVKDAERFDY